MATFYHNGTNYAPAPQRQTASISSVLSMKGLAFDISAQGYKLSKNGKRPDKNTPLANTLSYNYGAREYVFQLLRKIASTTNHAGIIDFDDVRRNAGMTPSSLTTMLNEMRDQGLLCSANAYVVGMYVTLNPGADTFLQKTMHVLHVVSYLNSRYGNSIDEIYYDCHLTDKNTGKKYVLDVIYRIGGHVYFINTAMNQNLVNMPNMMERLTTNADRIRSNYSVVVSPSVNGGMVRMLLNRLTGDKASAVTVVPYDKLSMLCK